MEKNKKIIVPALALAAILGAGVYGVSRVSAYGNGMGNVSIAEKIAEKFSLNKDDVQKVFDDDRGERFSQMKDDFAKRLDEAVSSGELTAEKKQLIMDKMEEMRKEREENMEAHKNLSMEERRAKMEEHRVEIEKWAKDNGVDMKYMSFGMGHGGGMGMGKGMRAGLGNRNN